jgi:nicotinamide-nucleotide amidase
MNAVLLREAEQVARLLKKKKTKIVFAESCTGGLVSAALASVPGISEFLCGSAVVYRLDTKARWLGIKKNVLKNPGPVSHEVAEQMAEGILKRTPEARFAFSVTGYLGPNAPKGQAGRLFIGCAHRKNVCSTEFWVHPEATRSNEKLRRKRQMSASLAVLFMVRSLLE